MGLGPDTANLVPTTFSLGLRIPEKAGALGESRTRDLLITNCPEPRTQDTQADLSLGEVNNAA